MTDVTVILDSQTAHEAIAYLHREASSQILPPHELKTVELLIHYIEEGINTNTLRERLAEIHNQRFATDEGEGPPPGDPYWEA